MSIELNELTDLNKLSSQPLAIKLLVVIVVCSALLVAGIWGLVYPRYEDWQALQTQEHSLKRDFTDKQYQVASLPELRQQLMVMTLRFGRLLEQLPRQEQVGSLIKEIAQAANSSGLVWQQMKPQALESKDFYIAFPFVIEVDGTYHQFANFISKLSALQQIVTVNNFDISHIADKNNRISFSKERLRMRLQVKTYRYHNASQEDNKNNKTGRAA